jgi:IS30 family transposase
MLNMGKLTDEQRKEIIERWKSGESQAKLAKAYGVSAPTVCDMLKRYQKKTQINPEFDAAVDAMIAESKAADAEKKSAIAEERHSDADSDIEKDTLDTKSDTSEPLPDAVYKALLAKLNDIQFDIEEREQRIAELTEEIRQLKHDRDEIIDWKDKYEH